MLQMKYPNLWVKDLVKVLVLHPIGVLGDKSFVEKSKTDVKQNW